MWDLPGPGLEPVSLALAGGFLTTAPPGKPPSLYSSKRVFCPGLANAQSHPVQSHPGLASGMTGVRGAGPLKPLLCYVFRRDKAMWCPRHTERMGQQMGRAGGGQAWGRWGEGGGVVMERSQSTDGGLGVCAHLCACVGPCVCTSTDIKRPRVLRDSFSREIILSNESLSEMASFMSSVLCHYFSL